MFSPIRLASATVLLGLCCAALGQQAANAPLDRAMQAKTMTEALAALGIGKPELGSKVLLDVPDIAIVGKAFTARVESHVPGTDWIAVFSERAATPLVKIEEFPPGTERALSAEITLAQTGRVRAIVRSGGKYYQVSREVKIAMPGALR